MTRQVPLKKGTKQLKRTELKRGTTELKRTKLNQVSAKRKTENQIRTGVLAQLRREEPWCHARCVRACTDRPDDGHELLSRGRGGSITDPVNIIMVCRPCHSWITTHPAEAEALDLARSRKGSYGAR